MKKKLFQICVLLILISSFSFSRLDLSQYQREIASLENKIQNITGRDEMERVQKMVREFGKFASLNAPACCEWEHLVIVHTFNIFEEFVQIGLEYIRLENKNNLSNRERNRMQELQASFLIYGIALEDQMDKCRFAISTIKNKKN